VLHGGVKTGRKRGAGTGEVTLYSPLRLALAALAALLLPSSVLPCPRLTQDRPGSCQGTESGFCAGASCGSQVS
jgi:hypothetical protein